MDTRNNHGHPSEAEMRRATVDILAAESRVAGDACADVPAEFKVAAYAEFLRFQLDCRRFQLQAQVQLAAMARAEQQRAGAVLVPFGAVPRA